MTTNQLPTKDLLEYVARTTVLTHNSVLFDGVQVPRPTSGRGSDRWLTSELYRRYYLAQASTSETGRPERRPASALEDPGLGRELRGRLSHRFLWETGWRATKSPASPSHWVERDGLRLTVSDQEVRDSSEFRDQVEVRFPAQRPYVNPGFFLVTSTRGPAHTTSNLARCYLHLRSESAAAVFATLVANLDEMSAPFTAKVLNNPRYFERPDACVVYAEREVVARVVTNARHLVSKSPEFVTDLLPAFTLRVGPGISVADEPRSPEFPMSFGQSRCLVIARGLLAAGVDADAEARSDSVHRTLLGAGLDETRLHLEPGSCDFEFEECPA